MGNTSWLLQLDDPRIFPQTFGEPFPPNFRDVVRTIFKRVFRVFAHMYHSHFNKICGLSEQAHLNTCFKHFMYFTQVSLQPCAEPAPACYSSLGTCACSDQSMVCKARWWRCDIAPGTLRWQAAVRLLMDGWSCVAGLRPHRQQ